MVFHWSLSDSKSPQVSRTLLCMLAVLNNALVWMVSTRPPTSKSSSLFSNPLVTVPNTSITIGIIVNCIFHSFFSPLARSRYLSLFSHFFHYYYYYSLIRAFHISVSRWFFTGVWVTASLLKSPGLFLVCWPFSAMLSFGWSPLVCQLPSPLVSLAIL